MKPGPKENAYSATEGEYATHYSQEYRKCGKATCRTCRQGPGHGPYWFSYHFSPALRRRVKQYHGKQRPTAATASADEGEA